MITFTKVLLEAGLPPGIQSDSPEGQRILKIRQWENAPPGTPHPDVVARAASQEIRQVASAPVATVAKKVATPGSQDNMRQTFNSFPDRGRSLKIAGRGQVSKVNPEHQAQFDTRFKQVVAANANKNPAAGVPAARVADVQPVPKIENIVTNQNTISGPEAVKIALQRGAHVVGDAASTAGTAVTSGAKHLAGLAGENPAIAGVAAGAAGALGLRRILQGKK
jgi:hypothetical protein